MNQRQAYVRFVNELRLFGLTSLAEQLSGTADTTQPLGAPDDVLRSAIREARLIESPELQAAAAVIEADLPNIAERMIPIYSNDSDDVAAYLYRG